MQCSEFNFFTCHANFEVRVRSRLLCLLRRLVLRLLLWLLLWLPYGLLYLLLRYLVERYVLGQETGLI